MKRGKRRRTFEEVKLVVAIAPPITIPIVGEVSAEQESDLTEPEIKKKTEKKGKKK